jgi:hypothetical protein
MNGALRVALGKLAIGLIAVLQLVSKKIILIDIK